MKRILLLLVLIPAVGSVRAADFQRLERPNIIFIMADDLGWRDVGCFGSSFHETPNIDKLAARGARFTQAYAASPLCSPTRSSILTGLYPARIGITAPVCHLPKIELEKKLTAGGPGERVLQAGSLTRLKTEYVTLAEVLKDAGYATAHFGKWHLGHNLKPGDRYEPKDQGFDFDFPHTPAAAGPGGGYLAPWSKFIKDPPLDAPAGTHIEERMAEEAAKYIHANKGKPFYVNYWAYSVHSPWNARKDYIEHFQKKVDPTKPQHNALYAAMVKSLDDGVGKILAAVDEAGIADRTIIVFFSDNGGYAYPPKATDPEGFADIPATSNDPLKSGKASLYEGGTRGPCIVVWPGNIKGGSENDVLLQSTDWHPTLLSMCGVKPRDGAKFDGFDQAPALLGKGAVRDRVFCHFPHGGRNQAEKMPGFLPGTYVRKGDWKLIRFYADNDDGSDRLELYNLKEDIGETKNLAAEKPELTRELNGLIGGFLNDTEAVIPKLNPNYKTAAVTKAASGTAATNGLVARGCTLALSDGFVRVEADGNSAFLGTSQIKAASPLTLKLRARSSTGGAGRVTWLTGEQKDPPPEQSVSFELAAGAEWRDVTVAVPLTGTARIIRLYIPAEKSPVEIQRIEWSAKGGQPAHVWDFSAAKGAAK